MAIFIFFLGTLVFSYFSRRYAGVNPRRQGPYRFVVFEGVLALVLMNDKARFNAPASPVQIVSWNAFALSIYLAIVVFAVYLTAKAEEQDTLATFGAV